jgi:hypothetical protein
MVLYDPLSSSVGTIFYNPSIVKDNNSHEMKKASQQFEKPFAAFLSAFVF